MIDDKYEKINENEIQSRTTQNGAPAQNNDVSQGIERAQSDDATPIEVSQHSDDVASVEVSQQSDDATPIEVSQHSDDVAPVEVSQQRDDATPIEVSQQSYDAAPDEVSKQSIDAAPSSDTNKIFDETQKVWQMQNLQNNGSQNPIGTNRNDYYKESYKRSNNRSSDLWKYILVSLISAIVGGAFLAVMILGVAPRIQPQLKSIIGNSFPDSNNHNTSPSVSEVKKVEIVQTSDFAVTSVAEKVGPSVIGIRTTYQSTNELFGEQAGGGEGSGIIISSDGYILTNHHVVENALNDKTRSIRNGAKIEVFLPNKIDKPYTATLKGYDSKTDLAVLKISETGLAAIEFGNSDDLKVGEPAIAFGNPGGLEYIGSLTRGVISGLNRTVQLDGGRKIRLVQTDAAINPGNSGGALVNIRGQLIGVNTIKMVATGFEGLGFAIPVNDAKAIADELIKNTYISKPYLGISIDQRYTKEVAEEKNMPMGVFVADVELLGAAQKAGIHAGDVILKFNKKAVTSFNELEDEKNKLKPGDVVDIEIYRDGSRKTVKVKLGETK